MNLGIEQGSTTGVPLIKPLMTCAVYVFPSQFIALTQGNFFTLTLVSGSTTHLAATNIKAGQTINLLLTQPSVGTGSLSYNSTFDFPAAANYISTPISASKDIITFITFDNSTIYASAINNLV